MHRTGPDAMDSSAQARHEEASTYIGMEALREVHLQYIRVQKLAAVQRDETRRACAGKVHGYYIHSRLHR